MTSRPPIALVKRGAQLYISGIIDPRDGPGSGLLRVIATMRRPFQAQLHRLPFGPAGEGDSIELAAQALVEKLQTETADFPAFLRALTERAEKASNMAVVSHEALWAAPLLGILAGLAAQTRPLSAIGPDDFTEDDDAIEFYADGEYGTTTVERLTLSIEQRAFDDDDDEGEELIDFTLRADGELHDGHSTLASIARSYPNVAPTLDSWKAGRTVPFAVVVTAARILAGLAEPLPEEA
jgi:hypothetical protein